MKVVKAIYSAVEESMFADFLAAWLDALDDSERAEALEELLEAWYIAWPATALTSPHRPIADAIVTMLGPWDADVAGDALGLRPPGPGDMPETVQPDGALAALAELLATRAMLRGQLLESRRRVGQLVIERDEARSIAEGAGFGLVDDLRAEVRRNPPGAGGPVMTDPRWTVETEALVHGILARHVYGHGYLASSFTAGDAECATESILTALADAGLLVPVGTPDARPLPERQGT